MRGEAAPDADIAAEIAPCFVERAGRRTDAVALACTHYPLLLARLTALAPWPVAWIDPAPAIARRVAHVLAQADLSPRREDDGPGARTARFTSGRAPEPALAAFLEGLGLAGQTAEPLPLA
jgi:glutamate racemase